MYTAAVLGASGYAGGELIRFLDGHHGFTVSHVGANSKVGQALASVHPQLSGGDRRLEAFDVDAVGSADVVFMALPHGASSEPAMALADLGPKIIDLGSDFRLDTPQRYLEAYGMDHPFPEQLGSWAYGIPELFGEQIAAAERVAVPGCYPTSVVVPLAPLLDDGLIEPTGIVADSMTGASGAGRAASDGLQFGAIDESVAAYKVLTHRHRPEMERALEAVTGAAVSMLFTPHLVPMQRGILSTIYATPTAGTTFEAVTASFDAAYGDSVFVRRVDDPPHTRWIVGSNKLLASFHLDDRTNTLVIVSAIDNLVKGAAGQAVQCANLMFGFDEAEGLPREGWMP
ncbi:MAG: N-acetyl-gamma-glutamyl-phosphate reductase [Acidimicrobiia bacterium]|nr:MAG: N-acetyl-gamma-glutamyl-phosphate reductase [Acidimicrobiia bacterium]